MEVTNVSARLHSVGGVLVIPGETKEIPAGFESAIDVSELVPVEAPAAKRGRPAADPESKATGE